MTGWSLFIKGLGIASLLWLVLPALRNNTKQSSAPWVRWMSQQSPLIQLLLFGLLAGGGAGLAYEVIYIIDNHTLSLAPLGYVGGWMLGTFVVGGWQWRRGRFPLL